jgi:hypothetical protein
MLLATTHIHLISLDFEWSTITSLSLEAARSAGDGKSVQTGTTSRSARCRDEAILLTIGRPAC